jgi:hypothetical protein
MASSCAQLLRSARMHVVRRCAVAERVCLSRTPPPSPAATHEQPNKARQGTSTRPATTTRRPSPLEYAKSQAVVTVRLYASLLTNPRNRYDAQALHALLDDWKVRCPHSSTKDVAIMMTAAAGAAARCGLPAVSTDLLERVPRGQFVPAGALRLVLQSSQHAQCASSARRSLQLIKQHSRLTIKDYTSAVLACLTDPLDVIAEALDSGLVLDNWAITVFVLAASDAGDESLAHAVWVKAHEQGVALTEKTLGAYLSALGDFGHGKRALEVAREHAHVMNDVSTVSLLTALSHAGMPNDALKVLHSLHPPSLVHINCVVDALARAGRLAEAAALLPTPSAAATTLAAAAAVANDDNDRAQLAVGWMSVLGGAVKHGDVAAAEQAAGWIRQLSQDRGEQASALTLLANAHRVAGNPDRAAEVHGERLSSRLWKEPGKSTVVVGKNRCSFVANDLTSYFVDGAVTPLGSDMRRRILARLERWGNACQHSEKLALAYAIETGERRPVLFKNIRMCRDCHESTLEITVQERVEVRHRDQNRWHVMKNGVCSCGNYW